LTLTASGAEAPPRSDLRALEAFSLGQWVKVLPDSTWPASAITYGPDRAGLCVSLLRSHPDWTIEAIGDVSEPVRAGKAIPRVTTAHNAIRPGTVAPVDRILRGLDGLGYQLKAKGAGEWRSRCPHHGGSTLTSLSIREFPDGSASVHCFSGCTTEQILSVIPWTP